MEDRAETSQSFFDRPLDRTVNIQSGRCDNRQKPLGEVRAEGVQAPEPDRRDRPLRPALVSAPRVRPVRERAGARAGRRGRPAATTRGPRGSGPRAPGPPRWRPAPGRPTRGRTSSRRRPRRGRPGRGGGCERRCGARTREDSRRSPSPRMGQARGDDKPPRPSRARAQRPDSGLPPGARRCPPLRRTSSIASVIGTVCCLPFLARCEGRVHRRFSRSSSDQRIWATSARLWPLRINIFMQSPKG